MTTKTKYPQSPEKFAWSFLRKYPFAIALLLLLAPIIVFIEVLIPWMLSRAIDWINSGMSREAVFENVMQYVWLIIGLMATGTLVSVFEGLYSYYKLSAETAIDVRQSLFSSILKQSVNFFNKNPAGTIYARLSSLKDGSIPDGGMVGGYVNLYGRFVGITITLFFIGKIYLPLAVLLLIFSIFLTWFLSKTSGDVEEKSKQMNKATSETFGKVVDICCNYLLIKTFGTKQREKQDLHNSLNIVAKKMSGHHLSFINHTVKQQIASLIMQLTIILYAIFLWLNKTISVGDVVYIMTTFTGLVMQFRILGYIVLGIKNSTGSMKYALDVFNEETDIVGGDKTLKVKQGGIEIKDLSFSYDGKKSVLKNINLNIAPQEKIGIVGVSGGGKTTLIHLLQRIFDYSKGSIKIDGQDIKDVSLESLYQNVAFIPQDTSLFHRSIAENISYGKFNASNKKIKEVAKHSYVDEFIEKLPDGYDTLVGDKGIKLSGGQRQRVGIARAIIKDAPILLLDEATSALDSKSEKYIQKAIKEIIKDKTVIAVAHRLSTLKDMDRIIVIDNGKIIEEGSPQKLLDKKGKFAKLWHIQMS